MPFLLLFARICFRLHSLLWQLGRRLDARANDLDWLAFGGGAWDRDVLVEYRLPNGEVRVYDSRDIPF